MSDLRELYQQLILDHNRSPRNRRKIDGLSRSAEGYNPLCGDRITVYLALEDGVVKDVAFEGSACAICTASASLMTVSLKGKTEEEAGELFHGFHRMVTREGADKGNSPDLGKLNVFAGVRDFPIRVKCATLPWHTFQAALKREGGEVSTE